MKREVELEEAVVLINTHGIINAEAHPACTEFRLGDGSILRYWDSDYEHDREWEIE